jgi:hypothetical protein
MQMFEEYFNLISTIKFFAWPSKEKLLSYVRKLCELRERNFFKTYVINVSDFCKWDTRAGKQSFCFRSIFIFTEKIEQVCFKVSEYEPLPHIHRFFIDLSYWHFVCKILRLILCKNWPVQNTWSSPGEYRPS